MQSAAHSCNVTRQSWHIEWQRQWQRQRIRREKYTLQAVKTTLNTNRDEMQTRGVQNNFRHIEIRFRSTQTLCLVDCPQWRRWPWLKHLRKQWQSWDQTKLRPNTNWNRQADKQYCPVERQQLNAKLDRWVDQKHLKCLNISTDPLSLVENWMYRKCTNKQAVEQINKRANRDKQLRADKQQLHRQTRL